jgi:uncharacterized protein YlxP (DUF503 family)
MIIGSLRCECMIYGARSLKDKRSVVLSIIRRAQNGNLAAAEVDFQDIRRQAAIAFVSVGSSKIRVEQELARALSLIDRRTDIERTETSYEWF